MPQNIKTLDVEKHGITSSITKNSRYQKRGELIKAYLSTNPHT